MSAGVTGIDLSGLTGGAAGLTTIVCHKTAVSRLTAHFARLLPRKALPGLLQRFKQVVLCAAGRVFILAPLAGWNES